MQLGYVLVCDYARASGSGKTDVLGVFRRLRFSSLPSTYAQLSVAVTILLDAEEVGKTGQFMLEIIDPSDQQLILVEGEAMLDPSEGGPPSRQLTPAIGVIVNIIQPEFKLEGLHHVKIWMDKQLLGSGELLIEVLSA